MRQTLIFLIVSIIELIIFIVSIFYLNENIDLFLLLILVTIAFIMALSIVMTYYYMFRQELNQESHIDSESKGVEVPINNNNPTKNRNKHKRKGEQTEETKKIIRPTGPLPYFALNYVKRKADKKLYDDLNTDSIFAYVVIGGIQTGKTSLILRYIHEVKKRKWGIIHIDFKEIKSKLININDKNERRKLLYFFIYESAIESLSGNILENELNKIIQKDLDEAINYLNWTFNKFKNEFKRLNVYGYDYCAICFDGLDHLFEAKDKILPDNEIDVIINLCLLIRNLQAEESYSCIRSLICSMCPRFYNHVIESPFISQVEPITLELFDKNYLEELIKVYKLEIDDELVSKIDIDYFYGQPSLMHYFIYELFNKRGTEIESLIKNKSSPFYLFLHRAKRLIQQIDNNLLEKYGIHQNGQLMSFIQDYQEIYTKGENT